MGKHEQDGRCKEEISERISVKAHRGVKSCEMVKNYQCGQRIYTFQETVLGCLKNVWNVTIKKGNGNDKIKKTIHNEKGVYRDFLWVRQIYESKDSRMLQVINPNGEYIFH